MRYEPNFLANRLRLPFEGVAGLDENFSGIGQDLFVLMALDGMKEGTYLEIGANEPVENSNTYLLEGLFGWRGLSVEIDGACVSRWWKRQQPCIEADALTLDYAEELRKHELGPVIDYLSLDIDPAENTLAALQRLPTEVRFRAITFEHDLYAGGEGERVRAESREYLGKLGYDLVVGDVAWAQGSAEDWWVDPRLTDPARIERLRGMPGFSIAWDRYLFGLEPASLMRR